MPNTEHQIQPNVYYIHKLDHRNGSSHKSQWIISEPTERHCFGQAYSSWRPTEYNCWGLYFENNKITYLGISKNSDETERKLFIAKFIDGNQNSKWHGYPADYVVNQQDIPPAEIRKLWLQSQYLRPAAIRKISKGQKCNL